MVGHSTIFINFYGTSIITDPVLVRWIPFPRRIQHAAYTVDELPPLDIVLVSHAHMDHANRPTLRQLAQKTRLMIVPRNCADLVRYMGAPEVIELDWEQSVVRSDVAVTAYEPVHWGQRYPWEDYKRRGYNSYVLEKNGKAIFFAGDTGYGEFFKVVRKRHAIDIALLPIGAYSPAMYRPVHMNPEDAFNAFLDLQATHMVPMHWANFRLSLESPKEPPAMLDRLATAAGKRDQVHIIHNGQSYSLPGN